jgi:[ribosomal protein S5]-alanine N-acetyltransferase
MQLKTARLLLRELEEADHVVTHAWESDPAATRWVTHDRRTVQESLAQIKKVREESAKEPRQLFDFALERVADGRLVGRAGFAVKNAAWREGMLWYVLHPEAWGQGYATEACRAILQFAFGELKMHRMYLELDPANAASARVAERLGMRREAQLVENYLHRGVWVDSVIYGILDREWVGAT